MRPVEYAPNDRLVKSAQVKCTRAYFAMYVIGELDRGALVAKRLAYEL